MSVRNWNFYYNNSKVSPKKRIGDIVGLWGAIGLLWLSFFTMMKEQIPEYGLEWFIIGFWLICMGIAHSNVTWKPVTKRRICLVAEVGIPFLYIVLNIVKITAGLKSVAEIYLKLWFAYNGSGFAPGLHVHSYVVVACTAILMVVWLILWKLSLLIKRPIILALFPLVAVLLGMLVGTSPKAISGWGYLLAAVFLLLMPKGMELKRRGAVVAAALICFVLCGRFFADDIAKLATAETKKDVFAWIGSIEFPDFNINTNNFLNFDLVTQDEKLDNEKPKYTGKVIFTIEGRKPQYAFYLKGFYGTDYVDGTWKKDVEAYEEACGLAGFDPAKMTMELAGLANERLSYSGVSRLETYIIRYSGAMSNTAYVPYDFDPLSLNDEFSYRGDYLLEKPIISNKLEVKVHTSSVSELAESPITPRINYEYISWYNNYAKKYAESGTDLECIRQAAQIVRQEMMPNAGVLTIAKTVRNYLSTNMEYSLELDELPNGVDPVEYALTVGHEGYCMHFATAGTLILRELGIPARYASGYVAIPYDFGWDATNKQYTAKVLDNASHAWVEIYVDNLGWIPVEMTPGYSSDAVQFPTEMHPDDWDSLAYYERETESESESEAESETESETVGDTGPTGTPKPSETESESESESESDKSTENVGDTESEGDTQEPGTGPGNGGSGNPWILTILWVLKWLLPVVIPVTIVLAVIYVIRLWNRHQESLLEKEIQKSYTRPAIKRMNRRIYREIRLRNFVDIRSDEDYEKALIRTYSAVSAEEWAKYMTIMKKVIYSREEISVDEMHYCHSCYLARKQEERKSPSEE